MSTFDFDGLSEGQKNRDEGMDRARRAADPDWKQRAAAAVRLCALRRAELIVDDVFADAGLEMPREGRAMGAVMQAARRAGILAPTGRYRPSYNPLHNACPRQIWRSLTYRA